MYASDSSSQRSGELRKNGAKIKLEGQPIQVLELLLERPQEVVTQDEIRSKLWPDGTVVEFEHSIKSAVKRLRQALDDDAEAPRYAQTLPRRGYRFIAPVKVEAGFGGDGRGPGDRRCRGAPDSEKQLAFTGGSGLRGVGVGGEPGISLPSLFAAATGAEPYPDYTRRGT